MISRKTTLIAFAIFASIALGSCTTNKKKKCDTCPKWTSQFEQQESGISS